jgi:hypothetical protein
MFSYVCHCEAVVSQGHCRRTTAVKLSCMLAMLLHYDLVAHGCLAFVMHCHMFVVVIGFVHMVHSFVTS